MANVSDTYKTLAKETPKALFKDRGSKFYGYAFPVTSKDTIESRIQDIITKHPKATHHCYAWQLGTGKEPHYRANDDGEPSNSAGIPIYGQIQSFAVTNVLIVVVRYYGGTNLGVGGLINAYRTTAKLALEAGKIVTKTLDVEFTVSFGYVLMNKVQRIIKEQQLEIVGQQLELSCKYKLSIRKRDVGKALKSFKAILGVKVEEGENG